MSTGDGGRAVRILALAIALAAAGCAAGAENPSDPLGRVLIRSAPDGYRPVDGPASGPMSIEDAAAATAVDVAAKRRFLKQSGFQGGYSRVWTKGDDYVTALAHEFSSPRASRRFVDFEIDEIGDKIGTTTFEVPDVKAADGYILSGVMRKGLEAVFCQSVWFPLGSRAFGVSTCGRQPGSPEVAIRLARQQYERAREG